ncbi:hypothetical protein [Thermocrispum sp.]|jgi:hypothetical protein|uniref:Uncharacterized protein n=1 Tax=Thermocrispum agreste TaxID=37925 RepID=A0A2W4LP36_9PSEU|nr:hypothetical protein [Thermocrispum sp.]PZM99443.1 MAG: hypothetical protein DIU77_05795 [Thermocrispum agreste]
MTKTQLTAVINDPRIADERHVNAYRVSGLLLVLYGFVPIGWTTYAFLSRDAPLGEFLRSVVWPVKTELVLAMTPYEWAFAVSLIVVGACALARRRAARGGAAALAVGMLVVSVREAVGAFDPDYRAGFVEQDEGPWLIVTRVSGLVIGVVVLLLMARARDDRNPRVRNVTYPIAGVVIAAAGALQIAGLLVTPGGDAFVRRALDPVGHSPASMTASVPLYQLFLIVAMVVIGLLAVTQLRIARGAALAIVPVAGYVAYFFLTPQLPYLNLELLLDHTAFALTYAGLAASVLAAVVVAVLFARRDPDEPVAPSDAAPATASADDDGQEGIGTTAEAR